MDVQVQTPEISNGLVHAIRRILAPQHPDAVQDVLQDAHLDALRYASKFEERNGAQKSTWFYRIAVNRALMFRRKHKHLVSDENPAGPSGDVDTGQSWVNSLLDPGPNPEERMLEQERREQLWRAIWKLTPKQREAILEFYFVQERQPGYDTCNKNGCEKLGSGAKANKFRAMRALRKMLKVL